MSVVFSAPSVNVWCDAPWSHLDPSLVHRLDEPATLAEDARRAREGVALLWSRVTRPAADGAGTIERVFWLDPRAVESVLEDTRGSGAGTRLEVQVDPTTPPSVVARVRGRFGALQRRGIAVDVRRGRRAA
jgi:hypothetical protein